nr:PQQ-dependent sugar dehydrogenase [Sphingomonas quercus]
MDPFPAGPGHDVVAKACVQCHDASMVTAQHQNAQQWSDTVQQMIANGAQVPPDQLGTVVAYLAAHFGTGEAPGAAPAARGPAAPAPRSKNDPPVYAPIQWRHEEGRPIETRWPEKQDNKPEFPEQTRAPYHASVAYKATLVTNKLARPWALQFLPDGRMLVGQRTGQMVIVDKAGAISPPLKGVPEVVWEGGQGGLLDIAFDPGFATSHRMFFTYDEPAGPQTGIGKDGAQSRIVVGRATLDAAAGALRDVQVIFRSLPAISVNLYPTKQGSRIAIDRQGYLYVTIGNRDSTRLQPPPWLVAQSLETHLGKIIRITADGKPAPGNPFIGKPDALPEIWATGTRSQEGLAFDARGQLWETEHGPRGGDELNLIERGKNYGWPIVTHGVDYPGWLVNMGVTHHSGMEDPRYYWDPVIGPSGLVFYEGKLFPQWRGSLFVGGLRGNLLDRLTISADNRIIAEEPLLTDLHARIRDVRVGPDGALYVLTDVDSLYRITPA